MPMLVELYDIVEAVDAYGCAAIKLDANRKYGFANYVFCFYDAKDGHYYANWAKDNEHGREAGRLGTYAESGEIILQSCLRDLYLAPYEDYLECANLVIDAARALPDAEYFDLLDADSMLALFDRGDDIVIGQEY